MITFKYPASSTPFICEGAEVSSRLWQRSSSVASTSAETGTGLKSVEERLLRAMAHERMPNTTMRRTKVPNNTRRQSHQTMPLLMQELG